MRIATSIVSGFVVLATLAVQAQVTTGQPKLPATAPATPQKSTSGTTAPAPPPPPDYVIGADDVLTIVFWKDKDMSGDVAVRPDGKISLPLVNDVQAAGLTPPQLRERLMEEAKRYIEDPNVTIIVRQINSRKVFITGQVNKPGPYPLSGPTTVLQLLSMAGGVAEFAHSKNIVVMRTENGKQVSYPFNYKDVMARKNLKQNIELRPGDVVIVP